MISELQEQVRQLHHIPPSRNRSHRQPPNTRLRDLLRGPSRCAAIDQVGLLERLQMEVLALTAPRALGERERSLLELQIKRRG